MDRWSVWLTDWLSVWLTVWLIDLLTVWLIDRLTAWFTLASVTLDYQCILIFPCYPKGGIGLVTIKRVCCVSLQVIDWLTGQLQIEWIIGWFIDRSVYLLTDRLFAWLVEKWFSFPFCLSDRSGKSSWLLDNLKRKLNQVVNWRAGR